MLRRAEEATAGHDGLKLTIAIAYGEREEIADAVRDLIREKARQGAAPEAIAEDVWVCSIDNLRRPEAEVSGILGAVERTPSPTGC